MQPHPGHAGNGDRAMTALALLFAIAIPSLMLWADGRS